MGRDDVLTKLVFNIPPELEGDLIDYLMSLDCVSGFTSYSVRGNGGTHNMTVAEQVSGSRKRVQVDSIIETEDFDTIVAKLKQSVGTDIVYWEHPVTRFGRV